MMWQSLKALDLLRDPRCTGHNSITDRMAPQGEFKLHGVAADIQDLDRRKRYCEDRESFERVLAVAIGEDERSLFVDDGLAHALRSRRG